MSVQLAPEVSCPKTSWEFAVLVSSLLTWPTFEVSTELKEVEIEPENGTAPQMHSVKILKTQTM